MDKTISKSARLAAYINRPMPALSDLTAPQRADLDRLAAAIDANVEAFYQDEKTYEQFSADNKAIHAEMDSLDLSEAWANLWRNKQTEARAADEVTK